MSLNNLAALIRETSHQKGFNITLEEDWYNENKVPAGLALIHSEVSEALEAFRIDDRDNFAEELADVLIRTLGFMRGLGIDIDDVVHQKMQKNRQREYRHGGKRI